MKPEKAITPPAPAEAAKTPPLPVLSDLIQKLGTAVCDQEQMLILAIKHAGNQEIVEPLARFIFQLNSEIFSTYEQLDTLVRAATEGGA